MSNVEYLKYTLHAKKTSVFILIKFTQCITEILHISLYKYEIFHICKLYQYEKKPPYKLPFLTYNVCISNKYVNLISKKIKLKNASRSGRNFSVESRRPQYKGGINCASRQGGERRQAEDLIGFFVLGSFLQNSIFDMESAKLKSGKKHVLIVFKNGPNGGA